MTLRPTSAEERWLSAARLLRLSPKDAPFAARIGGWRTAGVWSRGALFLLGLVVALLLLEIGGFFWRDVNVVVAGLICLVAAEWLIIARRQFSSGLEEALDVAGVSMLVYEIWSRLHGSQRMGALVFGAVLLFTGLRLLNPLLTTLAAFALLNALDASSHAVEWVCYGIAFAALAAGARTFRRPSYDVMLDLLVIVLPVAGYLWGDRGLEPTSYRHASLIQWMVPLRLLVFAAVALAVGLKRRTHPPLVAAMLCVGCAVFELRALVPLSLEARLIVWGLLLLIGSTLLERFLRRPRRGFTSRALSAESDSDTLLQLSGTVVLTPASAPAAPEPFSGAGGRFSGGGASGNF
jgi:hypothetical protein